MSWRYKIVLYDTVKNPKLDTDPTILRKALKRYILYDTLLDQFISQPMVEGSPDWLTMVKLNTIRNDEHTKEFKSYDEQLKNFIQDIDFWERNDLHEREIRDFLQDETKQ